LIAARVEVDKRRDMADRKRRDIREIEV